MGVVRVKAVPLIACLVFVVAGGVGSWLFYKESLAAKTEKNKAARELKSAKEWLADSMEELEAWQKTAGTTYDVLLSYVKRSGAEQGTNLIQLIEATDAAVTMANGALNQSLSALSSAHQAAIGALKDIENSRSSLESEIQTTHSKWHGTVAKMDATDKSLATEIVNISEKRNSIMELVRTEEKKWQAARLAMKKEIDFKQKQLAKFQEDINPQIDLLEEPDATVQSAAFAHKFVVLDIGHRQGVRPGMIFVIFRRTREGHLLIKGKVRVSQVEEDYCEAGIIELKDRLKPIVTGDMAQSPEFPQTLRYCLYGDFGGDKTEGYTKEEIASLVEKAGGILLDKIDITTDVILVGDISKYKGTDELDRILSTAKEFQIQLLRVPKFLKQLELRK